MLKVPKLIYGIVNAAAEATAVCFTNFLRVIISDLGFMTEYLMFLENIGLHNQLDDKISLTDYEIKS
jgi:hypothetical protein